MSDRRRPSVTVVVHHDGDLESNTYRVPRWLWRVGSITLIVGTVFIVFAAIAYTPIARTAARVPGMSREIAQLREENAQVRELARTLDRLQQRYDQVRAALGADGPDAVSQPSSRLPEAPALFAAIPGRPIPASGPSLPLGWPVDTLFYPGVITRGLVRTANGADHPAHPGVDIAAPTGTPIRASGGGVVREAGYDAEYGWFVLLDHPGGYQTMYGHASRLLVQPGDSVDAGAVIALVGSTGRSTAPHLHFEKRRGERLIDPLADLRRES